MEVFQCITIDSSNKIWIVLMQCTKKSVIINYAKYVIILNYAFSFLLWKFGSLIFVLPWTFTIMCEFWDEKKNRLVEIVFHHLNILKAITCACVDQSRHFWINPSSFWKYCLLTVYGKIAFHQTFMLISFSGSKKLNLPNTERGFVSSLKCLVSRPVKLVFVVRLCSLPLPARISVVHRLHGGLFSTQLRHSPRPPGK